MIETGEQILKLLPNYLKKDGQKFKVTNGTVMRECTFESFIGQPGKGQVIITNKVNPSKLSEQMTRMKELFSYDSNSKHDKFR